MDTWEGLDNLIDELDAMVTNTTSDFAQSDAYRHRYDFFSSFRHDWRPVWTLCSEIQEAFKTVRYPTKPLRDAAWVRFADIRNKASATANQERENFVAASASWRDKFIQDAELYRFSIFAEDLLFFLPRTTVDEMKRSGALLNAVKAELISKRGI